MGKRIPSLVPVQDLLVILSFINRIQSSMTSKPLTKIERGILVPIETTYEHFPTMIMILIHKSAKTKYLCISQLKPLWFSPKT